MTSIKKTAIIAFALAMVFTCWPKSNFAFRNAKIGAELPNAQLQSLGKKRSSVLSPEAKVNVFVFFRPNQEYSETALAVLGEVCKALKGRSVRCVAIVSDYYPKKTVKKTIRSTGWKSSNTLIDKEDLYYSKLGVSLHPTVGVTDSSFVLLAYETFTKANFYQLMEARIKYALGDINKEQLQYALDPPAMEKMDQKSRAQLNVNYAKKLFEMGKLNRAIEQAQHALSQDDQVADAYGLIGLIYAKQKKCGKAQPELEKALSLDKNNHLAQKGKKICK
jgi:tetratricopeptide (TPR) repeat protein